MRWSLLKDRAKLRTEAAADLDALIARMTTVRTARAWVYKEQLREILERKQINVVRAALLHWCTCVMRSKVEPMKDVAALVHRHLEGIVAWVQTRQTNGFLEALNGLFQAAKRRARGFTRFETTKAPAKKKCTRIDPFTKQERVFAAKPATVKIKTRALKKLKDAAL